MSPKSDMTSDTSLEVNSDLSQHESTENTNRRTTAGLDSKY